MSGAAPARSVAPSQGVGFKHFGARRGRKRSVFVWEVLHFSYFCALSGKRGLSLVPQGDIYPPFSKHFVLGLCTLVQRFPNAASALRGGFSLLRKAAAQGRRLGAAACLHGSEFRLSVSRLNANLARTLFQEGG